MTLAVSGAHSGTRHAEKCGGFAGCHALTANVHPMHARVLVNTLHRTTGPAAVLWTVWAVIVDAVKRVVLWCCTHVAKERLEAVKPFVAHPDPASAVVVVVRMALVAAALLHAVPDGALASGFPASGLSVRGGACDDSLSHQAAAAFGVAVTKRHPRNRLGGSTVALAQPERARGAVWGFRCSAAVDNGQAAEAFTGQVF
jgi:hypothetical protein